MPELSASLQPATLPSCGGGGAQLLVLIVSCFHHKPDWPYLRDWAERVHGTAHVRVVAGNESLHAPFEVGDDGTLIVRASDDYDALPVKMVSAYTSVLRAPELQHVTHVFKVDDTDVLDGDWDKMSVPAMQTGLSTLPYDYMTSYCGLVLSVCTPQYPCALGWHMMHVQEGSIWTGRPYMNNLTLTYGNGGFGYVLSRRAMRAIESRWPPQSMVELHHTEILEDFMVGKTLNAAGIRPVVVDFPGAYAWSHQMEQYREECSADETVVECTQVMNNLLSDLTAGNRVTKRCRSHPDEATFRLHNRTLFGAICSTAGGVQGMCSMLSGSASLGPGWNVLSQGLCHWSPTALSEVCKEPEVPSPCQ